MMSFFKQSLVLLWIAFGFMSCNQVLSDAANAINSGSSFSSDGAEGTSVQDSTDEISDTTDGGGTISTNPAPQLKIYGLLQSAPAEFDVLDPNQPITLVAINAEGEQQQQTISLDTEFEMDVPADDYQLSIHQQGQWIGDLHYDASHEFSGIRTFIDQQNETYDLGTIQIIGTSDFAQFLSESPTLLGNDLITDFDFSGSADLFESVSSAATGNCAIRTTNAYTDAKLFKLANRVYINFLMNQPIQSIDLSKIYFINVSTQKIIPLQKTSSIDPNNPAKAFLEVDAMVNQKMINQIGTSFGGQFNTVSEDQIEQLIQELADSGSSHLSSQFVEMVIEDQAIACENGRTEEHVQHQLEIIGVSSQNN